MQEPDTVQLKTLVPKALHRRLKIIAAAEGRSIKALVIEALTKLLEERER